LLRKDKISSRGAPSLLTPAQQAEAERNRILSTLEASGGKRSPKSPADAPRAARAPWIWALSGLLVAVLAGGAGLWYGQQGSDGAPVVASRAVVDPVPHTVAVPVVEPIADAPATATIEDDKPAQAGADVQPSLSDMLAAEPASAPGTRPANGASGDVLSQALEAPSGTALAAAAAAPVVTKAVSRPTPAAAPAKPKLPAKQVAAAKPKPKPTPAAPPDGDVMLLSALIAHAQAAEPTGGKKARASLEQELAYCKKQTRMPLAACQARACDGRATAAACKVKR
jgi:hypothetical protein